MNEANDVNALVSAFDGMTDRESVGHQLKHWVDGAPLHNTVRDECCPDFSCCNGGNMMPTEVRRKFAEAYSNGDEAAQWEILGMGLGMLTADMDAKVTTDKNELLCACHGLRGPGVMCGYVAGGGKRCKAPEDFDCEHKEKEDAKETD